jgi:hypothetical protein
MKKLILVLAIALMASPTFALSVYLQREGTSNIVDVNYSGADSANLPRAFALDVTIDSPGQIANVTNFKTGESTAASQGFGIYPARIDINTAGVVQSWGSPLADTADPGASGSALNSQEVILEFASLYYSDANKPATSGRLCQLTIAPFTTSTNLNLRAKAETTYRGGVVLSNGDQFPVDYNIVYRKPSGGSLPGPASNGLPQPYVTTATGGLTTDLSWTAGSGATSYDVYFGTVLPGSPNSANQTGITFDTGTMTQGKTYFVKVVAKNAVGNAPDYTWNFSTECYKSTSAGYAAWVQFGKPACWCYQRNCRGDVDGAKQFSYWVYTTDLTALKDAYGIQDAALTGNRICADLDRAKQFSYRVYTLDLGILKSYYALQESGVPVCTSTDYNFWMN